ncbi:MAG: CrcB family protein [bacterium]|nr:CrcB family protein [bacterium]
MIDWRQTIAVAIGGSFGCVCRYIVGQLFIQRFGPGFPYGTLFINVTGSFFIGVIAQLALTNAFGITPLVRVFLMTGIIGGYTTFSTFALENVNLLSDSYSLPAIYLSASVILGLGAAALGRVVGGLLVR